MKADAILCTQGVKKQFSRPARYTSADRPFKIRMAGSGMFNIKACAVLDGRKLGLSAEYAYIIGGISPRDNSSLILRTLGLKIGSELRL